MYKASLQIPNGAGFNGGGNSSLAELADNLLGRRIVADATVGQVKEVKKNDEGGFDVVVEGGATVAFDKITSIGVSG